MSRGPNSIKSMLAAVSKQITGDEQEIFTAIENVKQYQQALDQCLDAGLAAHCFVVSCLHGCLLIETDSATCMMELRYKRSDLLQSLRSDYKFYALRSIEFKVKPERMQLEESKPTVSPAKKKVPPDPSLQEIHDEKLREVMESLAKEIHSS